MWPTSHRAKVIAPRLLAAVATAAIAVGLAACGGSDSTSTESTSEAKPPVAKKSQGAQSSAVTKSSDQENAKAARRKEQKEASSFVPKHHTDSGGGSKQFEVKGGDNSVQEFGEEAGSSEFEAAAAVVHDFLDARADGNWAAVCTYMSKATITSIEHLARGAKPGTDTSCGAILAGVISPAAQPQIKAEAEKANVRSLRTEGEQAFVIYTGAEGTVLAMPMTVEGGEWKVTSLTGTPLN
jgi:hypothetical protein